jgi:prevent-host-death family protein
MKAATAKDLRVRTAAVLDEVRRGRAVTITYRGRSIAVLVPAQKVRTRGLTERGFGMWRGRDDLRRVDEWLDTQRRGRFARS